MSEPSDKDAAQQAKEQAKALKMLERRALRAEEQLVNYERLVDRTQHLLNTRIEEVEAARAELTARTQALEDSEARYRQLANAAFEAIITHRDGIILDCNHAAADLYGCTTDDLIGSALIDRVHEAYRGDASDWLNKATDDPVEVNHLRFDDGVFPVEVRSRIFSVAGAETVITVVRDITTFKEMEEALRRIANSDPLTGIGNRRYFMDMGKRELFRARRYGTSLSVVMMDMDHFKRINDTYGHDIGDLAINALVDVGKQVVRDSDIFARIGGEEFAIVLPNSGHVGAMALSERLRTAAQALETRTEKGVIRFTISIGVATLQASDEDIHHVLARADKGLYRAKKGGRNQVCSGDCDE